jgi:hypothetical protein
MIEIINKIQSFIDQLEEKQFYYYAGGFLGILVLMTGGLMYYNYSRSSSLTSELAELNDERETTVRMLLTKSHRVQKEQSEINAMLAESSDFKIGAYFIEVRNKLGLTPSLEATSQADREDDYRESSLKARFDAITMKQLLELLQQLEQNERIYTKDLEIKKSKSPRAIDVELTIATLQPKTVVPE